MAKKKQDINAFNMISMVDLLSGALGAVILLFLLVPKGQQINNVNDAFSAWVDPEGKQVWFEYPDSLKASVNPAIGDTLNVIVGGYKVFPKEKDVDIVEVNTTYPSNRRNYPDQRPDRESEEPKIDTSKYDPKTCSIVGTTDAFVCFNDGGTLDNPSDDLFTFMLKVNGKNTGIKGWEASIGGKTYQGNYREATKIGPLKVNLQGYPLLLKDQEDPSCVFATKISGASPCFVKPDDDIGTPLLGSLVFEIRWDSLSQELDLAVKKGGVTCSVRSPKTPFGYYFKEKTRRKLQEAIRSYKEIVPGTYIIYAHNYDDKQGSVNATISATIRDSKSKVKFFREVRKTITKTAFPGVKIGELTVDVDGNASFTVAN
ncbi:hypothetical protein [Haliscomenobacter hydrossis]|uniref:Uncharacterized protein n=1 Tax=Haliscomenobacter hydrossis (strain ATCC 27775 / DSM 1100 / LMG 10767 / O) TaxID=760192 RepID=F4KUL0_HALH1|nr:hypothetical protein [Haliscomenobacter hydrossis]AEE52446.1 hypothetical protein Halhy_4609 [Haliscomenobacter hydrossis DSM 1100]